MRGSWQTIANKTAVQPAEPDDAENLGDRIITAVGLREQGPAMIAEAQLNRQRAFTLLVRAYDQSRRAVTYLRWDERRAGMVRGAERASAMVVLPGWKVTKSAKIVAQLSGRTADVAWQPRARDDAPRPAGDRC